MTRRRHATGYLNLNLNSRLRHVQNMMGSNKPTLENRALNRAPPPKPIVSRTRYYLSFHAGGWRLISEARALPVFSRNRGWGRKQKLDDHTRKNSYM